MGEEEEVSTYPWIIGVIVIVALLAFIIILALNYELIKPIFTMFL